MVKNFFSIFVLASVCLVVFGCSQSNPLSQNIQKSNTTQAATGMSDYPYPIQKHAECFDVQNQVYLFTLLEDHNVYLKVQNGAGIEITKYPRGNTCLNSPSGYTTNNVLVAGKNSDGRIWVFTTVTSGSNRIWYRRQTVTVRPEFTNWTALPNSGSGCCNLALSSFSTGDLALFYRNASGRVCVTNITTMSTTTLPASTAGPINDNFTIATDNAQRLVVFTPRTDRIIYLKQTSAGTGNWSSAWEKAGPTFANIDVTADIGWIRNYSDKLEIYINTTDNKIYNCWQDAANNWVNIWNCIVSIRAYKRMTVGKRSDGGLDLVFCDIPYNSPMGNMCMLRHIYQLPGNGNWLENQNGFPTNGMQGMILPSKIDYNNLSIFRCSVTPQLTFFCPSNYIMSGSRDLNMTYAFENGPDPAGWYGDLIGKQ
jgi:hypothetical protein